MRASRDELKWQPMKTLPPAPVGRFVLYEPAPFCGFSNYYTSDGGRITDSDRKRARLWLKLPPIDATQGG